MQKKKIFFLIGSTASGKSAAALLLAGKLGAEIVSCDSMQVYHGMDILTSKPTKRQLSRVKHHLLSFVPVGREYNAAQYRKDALEVMRDIYSRGRVPLFTGGSGLYVSALIDGLFESVPEDRKIRASLSRQAKLKGSNHIYNRLKKIDPRAAKKIHPHDARRVIRALEVYLKTGRRISELHKKRKGLLPDYRVIICGINMPRERLYRRIDNRVDRMFKAGLAGEVRKLLKQPLSRTAYYALGVRELQGYFRREYGLDEAKRLIKRNSRHYAKRQLTWFRKNRRIKWINLKKETPAAGVAARIWKKLS